MLRHELAETEIGECEKHNHVYSIQDLRILGNISLQETRATTQAGEGRALLGATRSFLEDKTPNFQTKRKEIGVQPDNACWPISWIS